MEYKNILEASEDLVKRTIDDMQSLQRRETEEYLRYLCVDKYPGRQ